MNHSLVQESLNVLRGASTIDPEYIPLTVWNAPLAHIHIVPYTLLAYLTRRSGTYVYRLLLLPLVVLAIIKCTVRYRIEDPAYGCYNGLRGKLYLETVAGDTLLDAVIIGLVACAYIAKAIHFAVVPEGTLKTGEKSLPKPGSGSATNDGKSGSGFLPSGLRDALEVSFVARGVGWQFSKGLYVPKFRRSLERGAYIRQSLWSIFKAYLFIDFFDTFLSTLPGIDAQGLGGTIFIPYLPAPIRYVVSFVIHWAFGIFVTTGLGMWYDVASVVGVGLLKQSPALWPPMHEYPWRSTSLHEFWAKRWHQCLRDPFLVFGGYPGRWLAGDVGMLFGTFLASGMFHEVGFYLGGMPMDLRVLGFFLAQAFGILAEKMYRAVTGGRIGGRGGGLWVVFVVLIIGQSCSAFFPECFGEASTHMFHGS